MLRTLCKHWQLERAAYFSLRFPSYDKQHAIAYLPKKYSNDVSGDDPW